MKEIKFIQARGEYAESYCKAVDLVAKERRYLASTIGFPIESTLGFVTMIADNNLAQFYAIVDDQVIGWCDILPKSFEGLKHVGNLGMGLLPEYRGRGLGSKLYDMTEKHAKEVNNIEKVELEVFASNINAIKLYNKYGYNLEGTRLKSRKLDGEYDNIILMGKFL